MLVLSREKDQDIVAVLPDGRLIRIKMVEIRGAAARMGFECDDDIIVHRSEIYERIVAEGRDARQRSAKRERPAKREQRLELATV